MNNTHSFLNAMSLAGLLSMCAYLYLVFQSQTYAQATLFDLFVSCGIAATVCLSAWIYIHKTGQSITIITLLFWAIIFRIIACYAVPVLEDDYFRYLWDGYQFATTGSPYTHPPSEFFGSHLSPAIFEQILGGINNPDIITIYAPVTQWIFALCYWIAPGQTWPLQIILCLFDIALILILLKLAAAKYVILYAWNPLIIKEIAFTSHPDIIGVLFLFLALLLTRKHLTVAAGLVALAVASKVFAIIIAPLILGLRWKAWLVFIMTLFAICLPFLEDFFLMTIGLQSMATSWLFNAPIHLTLLPLLSSASIKLMLVTVFSALWCVYAWSYLQNSNHEIPRGDWLFGLLLLCIPALNPWYLIWLLPFAVIYPSYWAWTASIAVLLSYVIGLNLTGSHLQAYQQPVWVITIEFCLILLAGCFDIYRNKNRKLIS